MIAGWLRDRLWRADDWCAELAAIRATCRSPDRVFELARAVEYCNPDRGAALALYVDAARTGHGEALERGRALAKQLGAHLTEAELALAMGDPLAAGTAFLDGGFPELALAPLEQVLRAKPAGATMASEYTRLAQVAPLVAFARKHAVDVDAEIERNIATHTPDGYLHAERIARLAGLTGRAREVTAAARAAFPDEPKLAGLIASQLLARGNADDLLAHYRGRFDRAGSRAEYVESVRAAGMELLSRGVQPGLGLRLLRMSLDAAYDALLPEVRSHIAAWQQMWLHAQQQRSTAELVPLIVKAFTSPLAEDDAVFLARLGLHIAWRDAGDLLAAQPWAASLIDFVPDHPLAIAFIDAAVPEEPVEPVITFSAPKQTSKIPTLDEAGVKRSGPATSAAKTTSRVELLRVPARVTKPKTVPPPRAARLERNTSPIPMSKAPAQAIARAERKVVPVDVVVELPNGAFFSTVVRDLSTTGAFLVTKRAIDLETVVSLELRVPDRAQLIQTSHQVKARVARRSDLGWGVAFVDPSEELVAALRAATE